MTAVAQQPLPIFDRDAAWHDYDTAARALPGCEHNQAWRQQGRGRPQPPDCEHNRVWRAAVSAAWVTFRAASANAERQQ